MTHLLKLLCQTAVLALIYWGCTWFVTVTGLPIPGNVLGIMLLFVLLCCGVIKEEHISEAAGFLLKHLVFFFVPVAVGLMNWGGVFYEYGLVLLAAIVISSLVPLFVVGWWSQYMHERQNRCSK